MNKIVSIVLIVFCSGCSSITWNNTDTADCVSGSKYVNSSSAFNGMPNHMVRCN